MWSFLTGGKKKADSIDQKKEDHVKRLAEDAYKSTVMKVKENSQMFLPKSQPASRSASPSKKNRNSKMVQHDVSAALREEWMRFFKERLELIRDSELE